MCKLLRNSVPNFLQITESRLSPFWFIFPITVGLHGNSSILLVDLTILNASTMPMSQRAQAAAHRPNDSTTSGSSPTDLPPVRWYRVACSPLQPHPTNAFSVCPLVSWPQLVRIEEHLECGKSSCAWHVWNTSGAFAEPDRPRRGWLAYITSSSVGLLNAAIQGQI